MAGKKVSDHLGSYPLTLFVLVAAIVLYFTIRRARLGIDRHPGEGTGATVGRRPAMVTVPTRAPS